MENAAMTASITIEEASNNLLDLLERANKGEEITILKDGQQIARLVPPLPTLPPRVPGSAIGMITIAPDFDESLSDNILAGFEV